MAGATQPARLAQNGPLRFVCFINTSHAGNNTLVNINWQSCPKRRTGYGVRGGPVRDGEGIALAPIGDVAAVPRGCVAPNGQENPLKRRNAIGETRFVKHGATQIIWRRAKAKTLMVLHRKHSSSFIPSTRLRPSFQSQDKPSAFILLNAPTHGVPSL